MRLRIYNPLSNACCIAADKELLIKCDTVERIVNPAQLPHHEAFVGVAHLLRKTIFIHTQR